jgi:hypothetical protein
VRRRTSLLAVVGLAGLLAIASAFAGARGEQQASSYRYAGAVVNGRGVPTHFGAAGEGFVFSFFDARSRGRASEPYKVCVGRRGRRTAVRCWKRTARFGVGRLNLGQALPRTVPFGELTVRWTAGGKRVASWALLYARAGG